MNKPRYIFDVLRMNRVLLVKRLQPQLSLFGSQFPKLTSVINLIKPILFLAFVWHFASCLWSWLDLVSKLLSHDNIF